VNFLTRNELKEILLFFLNGLKKGAISTRASSIAFNFFLAFFPALIFLFTLIPYIPVTDFQKKIFEKLNNDFSIFLSENINDPKKEFLIPDVVNDLIEDKVHVEKTNESWFGVTYQEDKKLVTKKIKELIEIGKYPHNLWR